MQKTPLLLVLALFPSQARADIGSDSVPALVRHIASDQKAILTSPARMDRTDAMIWGATGLSMLILTPNYRDVQSIGERTAGGIERESVQYRDFFRGLTWLGDGAVLYGAAASGYAWGRMSGRPSVQHVSARWVEALADTGLWVTGLKFLAGRNRPGGQRPRSRFTGPWGYIRDQGGNSSFPSGHTALAFTTAAVFTRESDYNLWVSIPAYAIAGGVAFSRVYVEKHWLTDAIFGAALGQSIGSLVENRRGSRSANAWRWQPLLLQDGIGLSCSKQW